MPFTARKLPAMLRAPFAIYPAVLAACVLAAGCSSTPEDKTAGWTTDRIYSEAREELSGGSYDKAVPLLEKLEGRAAGTPLAQQAQLDKAYAHYKGGEKAQAWVLRHPHGNHTFHCSDSD